MNELLLASSFPKGTRMMEEREIKKQSHELKYLRNGGVNRGQPTKVKMKLIIMELKGGIYIYMNK